MAILNIRIEHDGDGADEGGINIFHVHELLRNACVNTKFKVTDLDNPEKICDDGWNKENEHGCIVDEDVCTKHDEPLICDHGCSKVNGHDCTDEDK